MAPTYRRVASLKSAEQFAEHLDQLGITEQLPFAEGDTAGPLSQSLTLPDGRTVGNRLCVQPMEGWDGTADGRPSDLVERRWRAFGRSGAKLVWGCEAVAVEHAGRANPNQLRIGEDTIDDLAGLRRTLVDEHRQRYGTADDLLVGLQLTHSGRFCKPTDKTRSEPWIPARHPILDQRFGIAGDHPWPPTRRSRRWWSASSPRACWPNRPATSSWTSSTATATSATSCSAAATAPAGSAGTSSIARDSCARWSPACAAARRGS